MPFLQDSLLLLLGSAFLAAALMTLWIYLLMFGGRLEMSRRMVEVVGQNRPTIREKELSEPFLKRILTPLLKSAVKLATKGLPSEKEASLARKIIMAGKPGGYGPREFMAIKLIMALTATALLVLAEPVLEWRTENWLAVTVLAAAAGWVLPDIYLHQKIRERKDEVERTLPDVLDLLTVSMEAGMGFEGAMLKVVDRGRGVLASEFLIVLQECKMGKGRKEALRDMAARVDADDLTTFAGSVIMAEQLGIGLGNVLRLQSEQVRRKRRQRAEEKAMKAPVKMLLPMVTCIFPTIFVILLGPAAISLYQTFIA